MCIGANRNFFYGALYPTILGAGLLGLQLRNGRVLLTLPFTARQIGRTVWVLIVVIPSLLLAVFTGPGIYLCNRFKLFADDSTVLPPSLFSGFLPAWIQLTIVGSLGFGSAFWFFTRIPATREQRNCVHTQLYGCGLLIAVLGGGFLLARSSIGDGIKFAIVCLLGIYLTVRGWCRAERMVIGLGSYRNETGSVSKPKEMFKPRTGYGGIPFLIMNCCIRYVVVMLGIIAVGSGITLWAVTHDPTNPPIKQSEFLDLMKGFSFYAVFLSFWMLFPSAVHQKFLRSLPLTSKKLAAVMLCIPVLPYLILCGIVALVEIPVFGFSPAMFSIKAQLLYLPPICVFATAFVWNNEKKVLRFFIALAIFILSTMPAIFHLFRTSGRGLPLWMIITIPLISCLLALYIINRLLQRNDMTYRNQMQMFLGPEPAIW
jgi:hypothetical protein